MGFKQSFGKFINSLRHHEEAPKPSHADVVTTEFPVVMTPRDQQESQAAIRVTVTHDLLQTLDRLKSSAMPEVNEPLAPPQLVQAVQSASRFMPERQRERLDAPVDIFSPFSFREVESKPIPASLAQKVFDFLSGMEDIAFKHTEDGCYARAHLMCQRLMDMGQGPTKAWALAPAGRLLTVTAPNGQETDWKWHVAPVLPVEMPGGRVVNMVFDPSIFNGPVTLERWGQSMGAPQEWLCNIRCGQKPFGYSGDYTLYKPTDHDTDRDAAKTMERYKKLEPAAPRSVYDAKFGEYALAESGNETKMVSLARSGQKPHRPACAGGQQQKRGI